MMNATEASEARRELVDGPRYGITKEQFSEKQESILKEFRAFLEKQYAHGYHQEVLDVIWSQVKEETEMRANSNGGTTNAANMLFQMELIYQKYEKFTSNIMGAVSPY